MTLPGDLPANYASGSTFTAADEDTVETTVNEIITALTRTGILKGTGTAVTVATAGTDYVAPGGVLGTPSSGTLTHTTGLPVAGISATGSASSSTFLRGDGTWNAPPGGLTGSTTPTTSDAAEWDANLNLSANNFLDGFTTTATAAGTTTLTVASTGIQVFTGSTTQTVKLPTTSVPAGMDFVIINQSTGNVTVESSGTNSIVVLAGSSSGIASSAVFTAVVASPTTAANWNCQHLAINIASGKILSVSNSLTLAGTDGTTVTFPSAGGNALTSVTGVAEVTGTPSSTTYLRGDGTWTTPSGAGSVTSASVVSANGFAGTVATATTTPAITLQTTLTSGVVPKSNGTGFVAATAGTDYSTPSATETLTNKTLTVPTITGYTESVVALGTVGASVTLSLTSGTVQTATLTASTATTFTMPTATAGKSFVLLLSQAATTGAGTATFTGVKWNAASGTPTQTTTAGTMDAYTFISDGTNWYGSYSQGYGTITTPTYDNSAISTYQSAVASGTAFTWTQTASASTYAIVIAPYSGTGGLTQVGATTLCTFGGTTLSALGNVAVNNIGTNGILWVWGGAVSGGTNQTVSVKFTQTGQSYTGYGASFTYNNVTSVGGLVTAYGASGTNGVTVPSAATNLVWGCVLNGDANVLSAPTFNVRQSYNVATNEPQFLAGDMPGAASTALQATQAGNYYWGAAGLNLV